MPRHRIFATPFARVYPLYVQKVERIRYLDKLIDELAKGKTMEKIPEINKGLMQSFKYARFC